MISPKALPRIVIAICVAAAPTVWAHEAVNPVTVRFERQVVNLEVAAIDLLPTPDRSVTPVAASTGIHYGQIIRRVAGASGLAVPSNVAFGVEVVDGVAVRAWCDRNADGDLTNDPPPTLTGYPGSADARAFLVELEWEAPAGWRRIPVGRTVRVVVEPPLGPGRPPHARVQYVHAMIGRWNSNGRVFDTVLFDGNGDGLYTAEFGDGFFIDGNADRHFEIDSFSRDFGPFTVPFPMQGHVLRVEDVDPQGAWITLRTLEDAPDAAIPVIGSPAPEFGYATTDGTQGTLRDHRGEIVVLYFWASWCGTCATQAAATVALRERFAARGVRFLGVAFDTDRAGAEAFRAKHNERWPTTFSGRMLWEDPIGRLYQVNGPATYRLINPEGVLVGAYDDPASLEAALEALAPVPTIGAVNSDR